MKPKRILLVTGIYPPQIGGPATFIDHLAHKLVEQGYVPTVICSAAAPEGFDVDRPFKVWRVDMNNRYVFEILIRLVLFFQLLSHTAIFVNGLEEYVGPIARLLRRRIILKIVGDRVWETARNLGITILDIDQFQHSDLKDARLRQLYRQRAIALSCARLVVTPSHYLRGLVQKWNYPSEKIEVVLNGIDLSSQVPKAASYSRGEIFRIVLSGRMTNWKGIETALLVIQGIPCVHLDIVGDGPERPILQNWIEQSQLNGKVTLHEKMTHAELFALYTRAHAYLLPSLYEGLSHALLEASACGLVCLSSDRGGNPEVITDMKDGLLLPYGDVGAWRFTIQKLIDDPELCSQLSFAARENAKRFDFKFTVDQIVALLR